MLAVVAAGPVYGAAEVAQAAQQLVDDYIDAWRDFYPSRAFAYGDARSAARFEDYSDARVTGWLAFNEQARRRARELYDSGQLGASLMTDLSVLQGQAIDEQASWSTDRYLSAQPQWYAEQASQALTHLLVRDQLAPRERSRAAIARLKGVAALCEQGRTTLSTGNVLRTRRALETLARTRAFYAGGLAALVADWPEQPALQTAIDEAVRSMQVFEEFLGQTLMPGAKEPVALGQRVYSTRLMRRSLGSFDPERLLEAAGQELKQVRALMLVEARRWRDSPGTAVPAAEGEALLALALEAMENDRQHNAADFLAEFRELTFAAERFVQARDIATVPQPTTLYVALSPAHFSGAAVGGVYPSGPFAPQAEPLFYVPSIPDDAPQAAKDGFYRSFNTHFNTMIISHEMFPGHYLQYKVAVSEAPPIRSLFPNGAYVEGWGSFVEELMLDAGWADDAPLTRLAHLRKRLENATRAYVSVQVHTAGWREEEVREFAVTEGLLAPQFAENLWQRVVHTPLQITDYFRGYTRFKRLYADKPAEQSTREWVDAVLRAGPLPITSLGFLIDGAL